MATDRQVARIGTDFQKLDTRNASVVITLTQALIRDEARVNAMKNGAVKEEAPSSFLQVTDPAAAEFECQSCGLKVDHIYKVEDAVVCELCRFELPKEVTS